MKEKAYAKINLCLDVIGRRLDGYHDLSMVMVPIDLYDELTIDIAPEMSLVTDEGYLPLDEKNTIIKAIQVMRKEFKFKENFAIDLKKNIPIQAGLAGGSSNGATTMHLVKKLLGLEISDEKMNEMAKEVGADVPFCVAGKPAVVTGIGEKLEFFEMQADYQILLVKPKEGVSTKWAFRILKFKKCAHPNAQKMKEALINNDYPAILSNLSNSLEDSAFRLVPAVKKLKNELLQYGFDGSLMSGSGSTVFALTKNHDLIQSAIQHFNKKGYFVRKIKILGHGID